jgi:hypothetical protein
MYVGGGGGSGRVSYGNISVSPNQLITVTIGSGGSYETSGGATSFGGNLLVASGGSGANSMNGNAGGSGGGPGTTSGLSGSGGSGGSSGTVGGSTYSAGTGQGSSFTMYFSQFQMNTLSAGQGAAGVPSSSTSTSGGGGGGGGVLINGAGPSSTPSGCYISGVWYGPEPATGYGAGGSGGCCVSGSCSGNAAGARGLIYIEY